MLRISIRVLVASGFLFMGATAAWAQDAPQFNPGDIVEAHSYFYNPPWHRAKVVSVGNTCAQATPYKVHFIGPDAGDHGDPCVDADHIRALAEQPPVNNDHKPTNNPLPVTNGAYKVGDRVDVIASYSPDKGSRGTIIEATGGRYKVHYDGCGTNFDAFVDRGDLHPPATISADAPDIKFLIGAWKAFTPSFPNTVVQGNTVYREYGMGATAPPLRINADGTYVWHDEYNKPPVRGRWTPDAKVEGSKIWTNFANGVVIKDSSGGLWKVYRWKPEGDNEDRITIHTLCSGKTVIGRRIR